MRISDWSSDVCSSDLWAWSSETLLVMDFVEGLPPRDGETLRAHGIDPAQIAATGADMVLDMVLVNGRFHADPHPGNLLCLPGNRVALLDLGSIGHVSPKRRAAFLTFVTPLPSGHPGGARKSVVTGKIVIVRV